MASARCQTQTGGFAAGWLAPVVRASARGASNVARGGRYRGRGRRPLRWRRCRRRGRRRGAGRTAAPVPAAGAGAGRRRPRRARRGASTVRSGRGPASTARGLHPALASADGTSRIFVLARGALPRQPGNRTPARAIGAAAWRRRSRRSRRAARARCFGLSSGRERDEQRVVAQALVDLARRRTSRSLEPIHLGGAGLAARHVSARLRTRARRCLPC